MMERKYIDALIEFEYALVINPFNEEVKKTVVLLKKNIKANILS